MSRSELLLVLSVIFTQDQIAMGNARPPFVNLCPFSHSHKLRSDASGKIE